MLENSRKRSRKSKLEIREGVELEETSVLCMEALEPTVKDEPMIDLGPTEVGCNSQTEAPFNDIPPLPDHKPSMEFSVKIEVEECDETEIKESQNSSYNHVVSVTKPKGIFIPKISAKSILKINNGGYKPTESSNNKVTSAAANAKEGKLPAAVRNGSKETFKEYVANKALMLKITDRLVKSYHVADKFLSIAVRNYAGRVLQEPVKDARELLLHQSLEEWQTWYHANPVVRDSPMFHKCYICGKSWWYYNEFREHVNQHMSLPQFQISLEAYNDECSLVCYQPDIVYNDVVLPKTSCDRCGKAAEIHAFLDSDPYKCEGCGNTLQTCSDLHMHEGSCSDYKKKHFPEDDNLQECSICQFECYSQDVLNVHMVRRHTVRSDLVTTWDVGICNICSHAYHVLALHICKKRTCSYGCNFCGRSFQKKIYKEIHMSQYCGIMKCKLCKKQLQARCMEFSHLLQHTDRFALMYKCIQCIEGLYYPDEFSIVHHTKHVHNRPFEKKFKYLEMVILPKQCLELSTKALQTESTAAKPVNPIPQTSNAASANKDLANKVSPTKVFVPSTKNGTILKKQQVPFNVEVKQEPLEAEIDQLCIQKLTSIKKEPVDKPARNIQISDITSLQELIKFKTEPVEEVLPEDLIIVEEPSKVVELPSSDDSELDWEPKVMGQKRKILSRYACLCGFMDIRRRLQVHQLTCPLALANRAMCVVKGSARTTGMSLQIGAGNTSDDGIKGSAANERLASADDNQGDPGEHDSSEDWSVGTASKNQRSGLKYTCHCKQEINGTLAAFKRHKKLCPVVNEMKLQRTNKPTSFVCTKCDDHFPSILKYAKHFHRNHQYEKLTCPQCSKQSQTLGRLGTHLMSHVNRNYLKIRVINERVLSSKSTKCKVCHEPIERIDYFSHWEAHLVLSDRAASSQASSQTGAAVPAPTRGADSDSGPDEPPLVIDVSANLRSVYAPALLQRALAWLVSTDGPSAPDAKTCVFCERQFGRQNDCKRHVIEHLLYDAYSLRPRLRALRCPICQRGFPKDDKFKQHMREHASLPVYQCTLCGKSFSDSSNFCKHKKIHDLTLLRCGICQKKFHNTSHLTRHMEMHERTKPIVCDVCRKVSFTLSAHKKHVRYAHERHRARVLCPICRTSFARLKDKWDHMWLVHQERKFEADCPLCMMAFRRFSDVKSHVRMEHDRNVRLSADGQVVVDS